MNPDCDIVNEVFRRLSYVLNFVIFNEVILYELEILNTKTQSSQYALYFFNFLSLLCNSVLAFDNQTSDTPDIIYKKDIGWAEYANLCVNSLMTVLAVFCAFHVNKHLDFMQKPQQEELKADAR